MSDERGRSAGGEPREADEAAEEPELDLDLDDLEFDLDEDEIAPPAAELEDGEDEDLEDDEAADDEPADEDESEFEPDEDLDATDDEPQPFDLRADEDEHVIVDRPDDATAPQQRRSSLLDRFRRKDESGSVWESRTFER